MHFEWQTKQASRPAKTLGNYPSRDSKQYDGGLRVDDSLMREFALFGESGTMHERLAEAISKELLQIIARVNFRDESVVSNEDLHQEVMLNIIENHRTFSRGVLSRMHLVRLLCVAAQRRLTDAIRYQKARKRGGNHKTTHSDYLEGVPNRSRENVAFERAIVREMFDDVLKYIKAQGAEKEYVLTKAFLEGCQVRQIVDESKWGNATLNRYRGWIYDARRELACLLKVNS